MNGQATAAQDVFRSLLAAGPGGLRRIDPGAARWSRLLHDARLTEALQRERPALSIVSVDAPPAGPRLAVELACGDDTIELELAEAVHPGLAMAIGPGHSDAMRHLAAHALLGPFADRLERLGLGRCWPSQTSLRETSATPDATSASPWFCIRHGAVSLAKLRISRASPAWAEAVKTRLRSRSPQQPRRAAWALPARVTLHAQAYGSGLLAELALGDVLVLPAPAERGASWPVVVRWGSAAGRSLRMAGRLAGMKVVMEGAHSVVNEEAGPEAPTDEAQEIQGVEQIDIPVRFEIETVPVPLAEIESLAPGFVIELASPLEQATLRLVACGQVIGLAELVAVGDRLGARITRLGAR